MSARKHWHLARAKGETRNLKHRREGWHRAQQRAFAARRFALRRGAARRRRRVHVRGERPDVKPKLDCVC